jgi:hypothetical protein
LADATVLRVPQDALRKAFPFGNFAIDDIHSSDPFEDSWRLNWPNIAALAVWLLSVGTLLVGAVRGRKRSPHPPAA